MEKKFPVFMSEEVMAAWKKSQARAAAAFEPKTLAP
jgi:hypothetical protein